MYESGDIGEGKERGRYEKIAGREREHEGEGRGLGVVV